MTRHFLTMTDVSAQELRRLIELARRMKHDRTLGAATLAGKTVALVFQKPSMRTRVAFEVAVLQLGGAAIYLGQDDIALGKREPVRDVARVLSRYVDAIVVRVFAHADAAEFATYSRVPVLNGLSDLVHPCQAVADLMTLEEFFGGVKGLRIAYIGDGNNVLHSFAEGAAALGANVIVASPKGYAPDGALWNAAARVAKVHGAHLQLEHDPKQAVKGADVIYTDVWVSMGQEQERAKRLKIFRPYQVDKTLVSLAKPGCRILHCLPAHRGEEITEDVMESSGSLIFEQAENRLHAHKALLQHFVGQGEER